MNPAVVVVTALLLALAAVLLAPRVRAMVTEPSGWTSTWFLAALAGAAGAGAAALARDGAELAGFAALGLGCAVLVAVDLASHRLPDVVVIPTALALLAALAVAAARLDAWPDLGRAALGGLTLGAGFLVLALISPRAIGLGDVKLAALLGIALGWFGWSTVLAGLVGAFVLGGAVAIVLLASGRASRTTALAFGPWLVLGAAAALALTRATLTP